MNVSFTRGTTKKSEYDNFKKCIGPHPVNACKNLLKIDISRLIQPILNGTGLSNLQITNTLIDDIDLTVFISINEINNNSNPLLTKLVNGALYRIAIEASSITGKDYANYLNEINKEVSELCDNIITLLNA